MSLTPYLGIDLLQVNDFYETASILHPLAVGSIAIVAFFTYLRLSSNRSSTPLTLWDKVVQVALGSVLASIVTGTSLTRGLLALAVLESFQYLTSCLGCFYPKTWGPIFTKPPLVLAFRGRILDDLIRKHRIAPEDLLGSLRAAGVFNVCEVECVILEPTGVFSVYFCKDMPKDYEADVLLGVEGYRRLVKIDEDERKKQTETGEAEVKGQPKSKESKEAAKQKSKAADSAA